jgi:hypothetical protein
LFRIHGNKRPASTFPPRGCEYFGRRRRCGTQASQKSRLVDCSPIRDLTGKHRFYRQFQ